MLWAALAVGFALHSCLSSGRGSNGDVGVDLSAADEASPSSSLARPSAGEAAVQHKRMGRLHNAHDGGGAVATVRFVHIAYVGLAAAVAVAAAVAFAVAQAETAAHGQWVVTSWRLGYFLLVFGATAPLLLGALRALMTGCCGGCCCGRTERRLLQASSITLAAWPAIGRCRVWLDASDVHTCVLARDHG